MCTLQDTLQPPVIMLNEQNFHRLVEQKAEDEVWMIDFYAPWCGPCQQLAPEWRRLAKVKKRNYRLYGLHWTIMMFTYITRCHQNFCLS